MLSFVYLKNVEDGIMEMRYEQVFSIGFLQFTLCNCTDPFLVKKMILGFSFWGQGYYSFITTYFHEKKKGRTI